VFQRLCGLALQHDLMKDLADWPGRNEDLRSDNRLLSELPTMFMKALSVFPELGFTAAWLLAGAQA
jgi:hypothetical protein